MQGNAGRPARGHHTEVGGREHRERNSSSEDGDVFHTLSLHPGVHRGAPGNGSISGTPVTVSQVSRNSSGDDDDFDDFNTGLLLLGECCYTALV